MKPTAPVIRLTSRVTSHDSKNHTTQPPIVRFIDKTTHTKINSASPASSSSTSSPSLIANINNSKGNKRKTSLPDDDDNELDLELNIDELFNDDSYSEQTIQRLKTELKHQVKQNT